MTIEYILNVNDKELYQFLINNLKNEMDITSKLKNGMKIKKRLKNNSKIDIEILNLVENREYKLKYLTNKGENIIKYYIEKINDEKVRLVYEEEYITDSIFNKLNYNIIGLIYSIIFKRKRAKIFKQIENYIIQNRGE